MSTAAAAPPFPELDQDTLRCVFSKISDAQSLQQALRTCTNWAAMANDEALWQVLVQQEWPLLLPAPNPPSWRARYLSLWRAEYSRSDVRESVAERFTLSTLNASYEFLVHIKHSKGPLLATARCSPVELTVGYTEACDICSQGEHGSQVDDTILLTARFPEGLCLPRDIFADNVPDDCLCWAGLSIHVARKADGKVAHFLTGNFDHYTFQDAWKYGGELNSPGVGPPLFFHRYGSGRRNPLWAPFVKHAMVGLGGTPPADGTMKMELEVELETSGEGDEEDEEGRWPDQDDYTPPAFFALHLKFTKFSTPMGDMGPFSPAFNTPLTLRDMPDLLDSLSWA